MATSKQPVGLDTTATAYDELEGEYVACQQQLQSKEQALRILQSQLKKADLVSQRLKQEIKQLHSQLSRTKQATSTQALNLSHRQNSPHNSLSPAINEDLIREKEMLILELEKAQWQISQLERSAEQLKEEKEELVDEKTHFASKCGGLVKCLEMERKKKSPPQSALLEAIEENKKLQLALVAAEAKRDHYKSRMERYKNAFERQKSLEAAAEKATTTVSLDKKQDVKVSMKRIAELESLANSLSQAVKVKSVTITHQKKANQILATKMAELEHQVHMKEMCLLWDTQQSTSKCKDETDGRDRMLSDATVQTAQNHKSELSGATFNRKSTGSSDINCANTPDFPPRKSADTRVIQSAGLLQTCDTTSEQQDISTKSTCSKKKSTEVGGRKSETLFSKKLADVEASLNSRSRGGTVGQAIWEQ